MIENVKHAIFIINEYYNKRSKYFTVKVEYYKNWLKYINNIMQLDVKIE